MNSFNSSGAFILSALDRGGVDLLAASDGAVTFRREGGRASSVAKHEAAHCVADHVCGLPIDFATVDPAKAGPGNAGAVWSMPDNLDCKQLCEFSSITLDELTQPPRAKIEGRVLSDETCVLLYAKMIALLAGKEATPATVMNSSGDIRKAAFYANCIAGTPKRALALLDFARKDAARILIANRKSVEAISEALIEHKTLDAAQIEAVLAGRPDLIAERKRRADWAAMTERAAAFGKTLEQIPL